VQTCGTQDDDAPPDLRQENAVPAATPPGEGACGGRGYCGVIAARGDTSVAVKLTDSGTRVAAKVRRAAPPASTA